MPSSTSSSDRDRGPGVTRFSHRDIPDRPWPGLLLTALALTLPALVGWEILARSLHHTPGTYADTGEAWAIERGKLDRSGHDIRVVLAGSSRMLFAADLDILEEALGTRPLQLALAGTSPRLIVENVVRTTDFDGLILVGYTPGLFNAPDGGEMGRVALDAYQQGAPSQRIGYQLHRRLSNHLGFLDEAFDLVGLVERYASPWLLERPGSESLDATLWKLGDMYADRQTVMWPPVETPGSFDWQQMINFWLGGEPDMGDPPPPDAMADMAEDTNEFFRPLLAELRSRGGDMVFIRMPSGGEYRRIEVEGDMDTHLWQPHVEGLDALSINSWDYPELSTALEIPEWSHLSGRSQDDWCRALIPVLRARYAAFRGRTLDDLLGIRASEKAPVEEHTP